MADSGHKNISRIDQERNDLHGWYFRMQFKGKKYVKFFNDKLFEKDQEKSLHAAVVYRNKLEKEVGRPRTDRAVMATHPNNETGVVGIRRHKNQKKAPNGKTYYSDVYQVTWSPEPNKVKRTSFSIKNMVSVKRSAWLMISARCKSVGCMATSYKMSLTYLNVLRIKNRNDLMGSLWSRVPYSKRYAILTTNRLIPLTQK